MKVNCIRIYPIKSKKTFNKVETFLLKKGYIKHKHPRVWTRSIFIGYIGFICNNSYHGKAHSVDDLLKGKIKINPYIPSYLYK